MCIFGAEALDSQSGLSSVILPELFLVEMRSVGLWIGPFACWKWLLVSSCWLSRCCGASLELLLDLHNTTSFKSTSSDTRAVKDKHVLFSVDQPVNIKDGRPVSPALSSTYGDVMDTFKTPGWSSLTS